MSDITREAGKRPAPVREQAHEGPHGSYRLYLIVWAALVSLTALTVTMATWELGAISIIAVLAIAATKSVLVLLDFMHLWWEKRLIIKILMPIVLVTLAIFIGLTYTDILYR